MSSHVSKLFSETSPAPGDIRECQSVEHPLPGVINNEERSCTLTAEMCYRSGFCSCREAGRSERAEYAGMKIRRT